MKLSNVVRSVVAFMLALALVGLSGSANEVAAQWTLFGEQEVEGDLGEGDFVLADGSYYDEYHFTGESGQRVQIVLQSEDFDTYLHFGQKYGDEWLSIETDDDAAGGTNSMLDLVLEEDDEFFIRVNSLSEGEAGYYSMVVSLFNSGSGVAQRTVEDRPISVCVIYGGHLREVEAFYNPMSGDTTVAGGAAFSAAYPATSGYASGESWYINNEGIELSDKPYVKYGLPRVLGIVEVSRIGEYMGVGLYAEAGAEGTPEVLYVPVRPGCEFQPYQLEIE